MKKLLTLLAFAFVALTANAQSTQKGDVNGDGDVSVNDVAMIVNYILGVANDNFIAGNADINGDGEIDINDVMGTVSTILGDDGGNGGNGSGIGDTSQAYLTCPDENHPHIIDLGLPSGTKWACCNVGADKPEEYGGYYAWGETMEKSVYNDVTYKYCTGEDRNGDGWYDDWHRLQSHIISNVYIIYGQWQNIGNKIDEGKHYYYDIAGTQYDVAHVKWGGSWVMPSADQIFELFDYCVSYGLTHLNGVEGGIFTGNNGGAIYLPFAGVKCCSDFFESGEKMNGSGHFWGSTISRWGYYEEDDNADILGIDIECGSYGYTGVRDKDIIPWNNQKNVTRSWGLPVRPVWVP